MTNKTKKIVVSILAVAVCVLLIVAFHSSKKPLTSVLSIKSFAQYELICTVYDVTSRRAVELKEKSFTDAEKSIFDEIVVGRARPEKNTVVLGNETDLFFSVRQNPNDEYVSLPTIRIIMEDKRFYINCDGHSYKIASDTAKLKDFIEYCFER